MTRIKLLHSYIAKLFNNKKQHNLPCRQAGNITIQQSNKGFTLIELLVVISIIAILMAVATVSYLNAQQKGRDNKRKSDLKAVQQALEIYYSQNGIYPTKGIGATSAKDGRIKCNKPGGETTVIEWGSAFTCDTKTFMNPTPKDLVFKPSDNTDYYYDSPNTGIYSISVKLENSKDPDIAFGVVQPCANSPYAGIAAGRSYCVVNP